MNLIDTYSQKSIRIFYAYENTDKNDTGLFKYSQLIKYLSSTERRRLGIDACICKAFRIGCHYKK